MYHFFEHLIMEQASAQLIEKSNYETVEGIGPPIWGIVAASSTFSSQQQLAVSTMTASSR